MQRLEEEHVDLLVGQRALVDRRGFVRMRAGGRRVAEDVVELGDQRVAPLARGRRIDRAVGEIRQHRAVLLANIPQARRAHGVSLRDRVVVERQLDEQYGEREPAADGADGGERRSAGCGDRDRRDGDGEHQHRLRPLGRAAPARPCAREIGMCLLPVHDVPESQAQVIHQAQIEHGT